jgi:hypothetical protein
MDRTRPADDADSATMDVDVDVGASADCIDAETGADCNSPSGQQDTWREREHMGVGGHDYYAGTYPGASDATVKRRIFADTSFAPISPHAGDINKAQVSKVLKRYRYTNGSDRVTLAKPRTWDTVKYIMQKREIRIIVTLSMISGIVNTGANEVFPLWAVTSPADGGLGFDAPRIALCTLIAGPITLLVQLTMYPEMVKRFGVVVMYRVSAMCLIIALLSAPMVSLVSPQEDALRFAGCVVSITLLVTGMTWMMTCLSVFTNNSSYSRHRGVTNGLVSSCISIGRFSGTRSNNDMTRCTSHPHTDTAFDVCIHTNR